MKQSDNPPIGQLPLVDTVSGFVSNDVFSAVTYQREMDAIFKRCWILLGHESSIPLESNYILSCLGEDSVIVQRDKAGKVRVYLTNADIEGRNFASMTVGVLLLLPAATMAGRIQTAD